MLSCNVQTPFLRQSHLAKVRIVPRDSCISLYYLVVQSPAGTSIRRLIFQRLIFNVFYAFQRPIYEEHNLKNQRRIDGEIFTSIFRLFRHLFNVNKMSKKRWKRTNTSTFVFQWLFATLKKHWTFGVEKIEMATFFSSWKPLETSKIRRKLVDTLKKTWKNRRRKAMKKKRRSICTFFNTISTSKFPLGMHFLPMFTDFFLCFKF